MPAKTKQVSIRVSAAEMQLLKCASTLCGLSVSATIRALVLERVRRQLKMSF